MHGSAVQSPHTVTVQVHRITSFNRWVGPSRRERDHSPPGGLSLERPRGLIARGTPESPVNPLGPGRLGEPSRGSPAGSSDRFAGHPIIAQASRGSTRCAEKLRPAATGPARPRRSRIRGPGACASGGTRQAGGPRSLRIGGRGRPTERRRGAVRCGAAMRRAGEGTDLRIGAATGVPAAQSSSSVSKTVPSRASSSSICFIRSQSSRVISTSRATDPLWSPTMPARAIWSTSRLARP